MIYAEANQAYAANRGGAIVRNKGLTEQQLSDTGSALSSGTAAFSNLSIQTQIRIDQLSYGSGLRVMSSLEADRIEFTGFNVAGPQTGLYYDTGLNGIDSPRIWFAAGRTVTAMEGTILHEHGHFIDYRWRTDGRRMCQYPEYLAAYNLHVKDNTNMPSAYRDTSISTGTLTKGQVEFFAEYFKMFCGKQVWGSMTEAGTAAMDALYTGWFGARSA